MPSVDVVPIRLVGVGEEHRVPAISARDAGIEPSGSSRSGLVASPSRFLGVVVPQLPTQWTPSKQTSNARRDRNLNPRTTNAGPATVTKPNAHFDLTTNDGSVDDTPTSVDDESLGVCSHETSVRRVLDDPPVPVTKDVPHSVVNSRPAVPCALDVPAIHSSAATIEDRPYGTEEDILELVSPEVARDYDMQGIITYSDSGITETDAESFSYDTLPTNRDATNEADATDRENVEHAIIGETEPHSRDEAPFTGSIVDALARAFVANNFHDSGIGTSPPPSPSSPPAARQSLFLESFSDSESGTPEPAALTSRPVPAREPQASLHVSRAGRAHETRVIVDTKGRTDKIDEYLDAEGAPYAYDKTAHSSTLQAYERPPMSTGPPEPLVICQSQYTSVTEHFLQRVEEWFGPEALKQLDQATLDGPSKNIRKGLSSTKPSTPVPAPSSTANSSKTSKRKNVASTRESSTIKEPPTKKLRTLENLNNAPSRDSHKSRVRQPGEPSSAERKLLRKFIKHTRAPTDEEVNAVNLLISRLNLDGEHNVYEGKTTSNGYFRVMIPKSLVAIASRRAAV